MPFRNRFAVTALLSLIPTAAFAHHPAGGMAPQGMGGGLLSGLAHPVIGLDHLAFIIGVGLLAALTAHRFAAPLLFIGATVAGTLLHLMAFDLPAAEFVVALSVAGIGILALSGRSYGMLAIGSLFAVAGLFHGYAYGEAVVGSESGAVAAYLIGFAAIQYVVAVSAGFIAVRLLGSGLAARENFGLRVSGGVVAGAGAMILGEQLLAIAGLAG
ncbi:MAG: HupE/UreJ family protein [Aurantimonas coralicida]|uniref:HupE/UreJ family protein n=1 Tax=Aurantimonas TaxID=182269 RepID=UPI0004628AD4|nr:HupE/UreJ family protein [Aurantimonas coralicida]